MTQQHFVREVWAQAWPNVITMASYTVMQFVAALMVAQVSPLAVAAQGNGSVWSFAPMAFLFGAMSLVNAFVAQSIGAGRRDAVARYAGAGLWFAALAWLFVMVPWGLALPHVFARLPHEAELERLESGFARILAFGSIAALTSKAMSYTFFGLQRPRVVTIAALVGNLVNGVVSYALIFGAKGLESLGIPGVPSVPAIGVMGAAVGTVVGTATEATIPLTLFFGRSMHAQFVTRSAWRFPARELRDLVRVGGPASIQFGNELLCWAIFMTVLVGHFGSLATTAGWATMRYLHLSFMPAAGIGVAATSLVGRSIGEGRPDLAQRRARAAVFLAVGYMAVCAAVMILFRHALVRLFASSAEATPESVETIVSIGGWMMICAAVFQIFDAVGIVYSGALRGAGDTFVPGVAAFILSWVLIVGLGVFLVYAVPQLGSVGPWVATAGYIIALGLWMAVRFERGRWRSRRLVKPSKPLVMASVPASDGV